MPAAWNQPDKHMILPRVRWDTFERLLDDIGKRRFRVSYLDGDLEFITTELEHHCCAQWISRLIFFAAMETDTPIRTGGSFTMKAASRRVAIEPDACFWIRHEKRMRGKKDWIAASNPPPDLAVEIAVDGSLVDRLEIYAALMVPEVWRFDGDTLKVLVLGANGKYKARAKSLAFPSFPMDGFARFVKKLGSDEVVSLTREFTEWLRSEVIGKKAGGERKNGRK